MDARATTSGVSQSTALEIGGLSQTSIKTREIVDIVVAFGSNRTCLMDMVLSVKDRFGHVGPEACATIAAALGTCSSRAPLTTARPTSARRASWLRVPPGSRASACNTVYGDAQAALVQMIEAVRGLGTAAA